MHYIFAIKMHMHVKHFLAFIMQGWNFILKKSNDYMTGGMGEKFISLLMVDNYCYYKYFIQYDFFTLPKTPEVFVTFCCPENIWNTPLTDSVWKFSLHSPSLGSKKTQVHPPTSGESENTPKHVMVCWERPRWRFPGWQWDVTLVNCNSLWSTCKEICAK